jgi:fumarate reductase subunit D
MTARVAWQAHAHPAWWAFAVHRVSGLALALFLPVHFWALGTALRGDTALDGFLRFAAQPAVKLAEWGLVVLLALHLAGGVRLLLIEFGPWRGLRKDWIAGTAGAGAFVGLAYALALWR